MRFKFYTIFRQKLNNSKVIVVKSLKNASHFLLIYFFINSISFEISF